MLKHRRTVNNRVSLTELGMGVAQFGNLHRETTDEESAAAVAAAWARGIRYFDTAPHYGLGLSERRLGAALAPFPRDEYVVSTKVGRVLVPSPETADTSDPSGFLVPADVRREWDFSRDGILRSLESSLLRTGLDRIDVVYLHDPDDHFEAASTTGVEALIELRDQGVISAIGAGMNQSAMLADLVRRCDIDLVMVAGRFTLLDQDALDDLVPTAADRGISIVVAAIYNSGILSSDRVAIKALFNYETAPDVLRDRVIAISHVCERFGVHLPEAAVAYPLRNPAVASVVVGMRTSGQVESNVARYLTEIPEDLWAELLRQGLIAA